jgi:hypothetical protein
MKFKRVKLSISGALALVSTANALTIEIDYRYDTNNFFDTPEKRAAMQEVADRWSAIITQKLNAVSLDDDGLDARIGFTHPATGEFHQVSPANNAASDALYTGTDVPSADEYRGPWMIPKDTLIIYAGGRVLSSAGRGGTGIAANFSNVNDDPLGVTNRGFNIRGLPVWGGSVTFDTDRAWNFDIDEESIGASDFYTVALHEVGHVLGLASKWEDFSRYFAGDFYTGPNALAAYNADNDSDLVSLELVDPATSNEHWRDGLYQSEIFQAGNPVLLGTVGLGVLQDLLMEPEATYRNGITRFEVTRTDVGALQDIGWATISESFGTPLEDWRETFFATREDEGDAANDFDFDHDGLPNLLEYALGSDPTLDDHTEVEVAFRPDRRFALTFPFDEAAAGINVVVEGSDDLSDWEPLAESAGNATLSTVASGVTVEALGTSSNRSFEVGDVAPASPQNPRRFLRIVVFELSGE